MVKSGTWNELDQGRPKAIHLLEQRVTGTWPHIAYVQFLGLSDHTVTLASKWGQVKAYSWGRSHCTETNVNDLDSVGFPANHPAQEGLLESCLG